MSDPRTLPLHGIADPHDPSVEWSATQWAVWCKLSRGGDWLETGDRLFTATPERKALWTRLLTALL